MKVLIFQYEPLDNIGVYQDFLTEDGHNIDLQIRKEGEALPDLADYEALWVFGIHADLDSPWMIEETAFIRNAVFDRGLPYFGIGLGHLLLAKALGGAVVQDAQFSIGMDKLQLTHDGASGVFLDGVEEQFTALVSQSGRITELPADIQCLVVNESTNPVQAMKWETRAHSTQFHFEISVDSLSQLDCEKTVQIADKAALCASLEAQKTAFEQNAERLYINWLQTSAQTRSE